MTRLFGVIGHPISHSLSPVMHQAAYNALGLNALYAPFDVPPRQLTQLLDALLRCGVDGLNVTVPHKEAVFRYLQRRGSIDPVARQIGAVNTLVRRGRQWVGYNTDWLGFREAVRRDLKWRRFDDELVLLLGAGGAARGVVRALKGENVWMYLSNRTTSRLAQFATWVGSVRSRDDGLIWLPWPASRVRRIAGDVDVVINATSLGLRDRDPLPIDPRWLKKGARVIDLTYRKPTTELVRRARRRGLLAVDGLPMLVYQGAASFELWWHRKAPIAAMRRAVEGGSC